MNDVATVETEEKPIVPWIEAIGAAKHKFQKIADSGSQVDYARR